MTRIFSLVSMLGFGLIGACATSSPEKLEDIEARALAACPAAIERSNAAGDYDYSLGACECIAQRITTPLWSDEASSYSGEPMPIKDARIIAKAIRQGETLGSAMDAALTELSVKSANSVNTCFAKS